MKLSNAIKQARYRRRKQICSDIDFALLTNDEELLLRILITALGSHLFSKGVL